MCGLSKFNLCGYYISVYIILCQATAEIVEPCMIKHAAWHNYGLAGSLGRSCIHAEPEYAAQVCQLCLLLLATTMKACREVQN